MPQPARDFLAYLDWCIDAVTEELNRFEEEGITTGEVVAASQGELFALTRVRNRYLKDTSPDHQ